MKVRELIAKLQTLPQTEDVFFVDFQKATTDWRTDDEHIVEIEDVKHDYFDSDDKEDHNRMPVVLVHGKL